MDSGARRVSTGVEGLDSVLDGGFLESQSYLVRGAPGTGKTTLGLQFLTATDDDALYVNLGENQHVIERVAEGYGFPLSEVAVLDLSPDRETFVEDEAYDVFSPAEVERSGLVDRIESAVSETQPDRVFVDPVTQFRYLMPDDFQVRKQVLAFLDFLTGEGATVLFTSQNTHENRDEDLQFLSDGTLTLSNPEGGPRQVTVEKFRASDFAEGSHTLTFEDDGVAVYPKLQPRKHGREFETRTLTSGIEGLDEQLHGGVRQGSVTLIAGPTGVGKTTLGTTVVTRAASTGTRAALFLFEEDYDTLVTRSEGIGLPLEDLHEDGALSIEEVEPLSVSADEFAGMVREQVEENDVDLLLVDGIQGYQLSVTGDDLLREIHALSRYCRKMGVTVLFTTEIEQLTGETALTGYGGTYLADNIVLLRHLELQGELTKAIGVVKKRTSGHGQAFREFDISADGIEIGAPLTGLRGVVDGRPEVVSGGNKPEAFEEDR